MCQLENKFNLIHNLNNRWKKFLAETSREVAENISIIAREGKKKNCCQWFA